MNVSKMEFFNNNNFYTAGLFIVFFFLLDILVTSVFVLAGISLYYPLFIALVVSIGVLGWCRYGFLRLPVSFPVVLTISLVVIILSFFLSGVFYDYSYDGRIHFQEPVIQLAQGWNSFTTGFKYGDYWWGYRWVEAYPLGIQFYSVSVYQVFGMLYAKSFNFLILGAAFLAIFPCLRRTFRSLTAVGITLAVLFYPCVISQLWTMYIDGFIYLMFIIGVSCLSHFVFIENRSLKYASVIIVAGIIIFYPVFKISCIMFSGILFLTCVWLCRKQRRFLVPFAVILPVILLIGWQPYFNHNLFDTIETVAFSANRSLWPYLGELPGPLAYFANMFAVNPYTNDGIMSGFYTSRLYYDYSQGLYSYWWVILFFITLAYSLMYIKKYRAFIFLLILLFLPMAITSLINQRYYPLPYLFPFLILAAIYKNGNLSKPILYVCNLLIVGQLVFSFGGLWFTVGTNSKTTAFIQSRLEQIKAMPDEFLYVEFFGTGEPALLQEAFSDRLWLNGIEKTFYIPNHVINEKSLPERFKNGSVLSTASGFNAPKIDIGIKNDNNKPLAVQVFVEGVDRFNLARSPDILIFMYISNDKRENAGGAYDIGFTTLFVRAIRESEQQSITFELPAYAKRLELSTNTDKISFSGFEIREVEINLPEY